MPRVEEPIAEIVEVLTDHSVPSRGRLRDAASHVDRIVEAVSGLAGMNFQVRAEGFRRMTEGAAPASLAALASDLECFSRFCCTNGLIGLPCEPETIARYVDALEVQDFKLATVRRRLASISTLHKLGELPSPVQSALVSHAIKAFRRRRGSIQRQAAPLRFKTEGRGGNQAFTIEALLKVCRSDLQGLRDAALVSVAYDAGLRVSELTAIEVSQIEPAQDGEDDSGILFLPRSKTDQAGEGAYAWLSPASMTHVQAWLIASGIKEGPLFRRVAIDRRQARQARAALEIRDLKGNALVDRRRMAAKPAQLARTRYMIGDRALTRHGVAAILRRLAFAAADDGLVSLTGEALGIAVSNLSTHSLRVGLTQDLFAAGEDVGPVAQALRWKSPATALRYARKLRPSQNAAARTLRQLRGET